ncbi:diguanylate cyclase [Arcobacter sp. CECT 8983]|uniref:EAL domain-containing protein n=1 Tax=Arcobacter sp. CECT 8983 TaxID=2044508 RepID=UPI00100A2D5F|nr:EAL domain-containing protein [Arcobacter sp. CECT 8983]RXJ90871.1 diguanylate cyclase [Arcobacter sp. CECT 8983]
MAFITDVYYKELFENAPMPMFIIDDGLIVEANDAMANVFKVNTKEDIYKLHPSQLSPKYQPDGKTSEEKANEIFESCLKYGFVQFEWLHKDLEDKEFLVEITLKTIIINQKQMFFTTFRDITKEKDYEENLKKKNEKLENKNKYFLEINKILKTDHQWEQLIDKIFLLEEFRKALDESSIVSKTDKKGIITYVNDNFCKISGYQREELLGQSHNIIRHPNTKKEFFKNLWEKITNKEVFKGIIENKKKNGDSYFVDTTIVPILDKNDEIVEFIGIRNDLTQVFEKDKVIYEQFTDDLTSLPNRQRLLDDIKKFVKPKLALINIDRFKDINDAYGFEVGDEILKILSKRLIKYKSTNLKVYRLSGDVFGLLAYGNISEKELLKTTDSIIHNPLVQKYNINNYEFDISYTVGLAGHDDKLLTQAEVALQWAKRTHKDIVLFDENMPAYKELRENIALTKQIKTAIENNNILIYGQKIVCNTSNDYKYETLMRLKLEDGTIVSPFKFLNHAKKARLYPLMTRIVIDKACNYFKDRDEEFSINLMIEDIKDRKTIDYLISKLKETNTAHKITLEIVESEEIEKFEEVGEFIKEVHKLGCKVAIDDFGTGYSNFEYIIQLKVDILKIDGSLIKNIHINDNLRLTVSTIVNFAKVLNIQTVAEFIHNKEVDEIVKSLKIDYSQGFYHHEPELLN